MLGVGVCRTGDPVNVHFTHIGAVKDRAEFSVRGWAISWLTASAAPTEGRVGAGSLLLPSQELDSQPADANLFSPLQN